MNFKLVRYCRITAHFSAICGNVRLANFRSISLSLLLGTASCSTTQAPTFYVGVGAGGSRLDLDPGTTGLTVADGGDSAAQVFLGADVVPRVGVEGFYADLGDAVLSNDELVAYSAYGASALLYLLPGSLSENNSGSRESMQADSLPMRRSGFSLYGKFGVASVETESDVLLSKRNPVNLTTGVGAEYGFKSGVGIRFDLTSHDADAQHLQLSLLYRFGSGSSKSPTQTSNDIEREPVEEPVTGEPRLDISPLPPITEPAALPENVSEQAVPETQPEVTNPAVTNSTEPEPELEIADDPVFETPVNIEPAAKAPVQQAPVKDTVEIPKSDPDEQARSPVMEPGEKPREEIDLPEVVAMTDARIEEQEVTPAPKPVDSDSDGIDDSKDACDNSSTLLPIDSRGCNQIEGFIEGIEFEQGSAVLTVEAKSTLNDLAAEMAKEQTTRYSVLTIPAKTDESGLSAFLAKRRTLAVIRYLIARSIPGSRLRAAVLEESQQSVDNRDMSRSWVVFRAITN